MIATLTQGTSGMSTISTAVTSGNAQTVNLSVTGVPTSASAGLNPTSVTSGGSSTLTVNAGTAAPGTYPLTVTGTGTSATHSTTVTLTVRAPVTNDFSISANPNSLTVAQAHSGTSTISTAVTAGSAQTINLSISGVPAGASATFNPTSITAGNSSTLTVHAGTAAPGTYPLTVTGTGTSATHSTTVTLIVPRNDCSISASPARVSVPRGSSARYTVRTAIVSGRSQRVTFSVSGVPAGSTATFTPTSVITGASSALRVTTSAPPPRATTL